MNTNKIEALKLALEIAKALENEIFAAQTKEAVMALSRVIDATLTVAEDIAAG